MIPPLSLKRKDLPEKAAFFTGDCSVAGVKGFVTGKTS
jgi:hypothetical protein